MSKPIPNVPLSSLSFEQRLQLVQAEIKARVATHPTNKQNGIRARLWVRWLTHNVLEVQS